MDFVVSKVAMSVCALLVVGVLSGALGSQDRDVLAGGLQEVAAEVCSLMDRAVASGAETAMRWPVPELASGDPVTVSVFRGVIRASSAGLERVCSPLAGIHTWTWTGIGLNESAIRLLDHSSGAVEARTGQTLVLSTQPVLVDDELAVLGFVRGPV